MDAKVSALSDVQQVWLASQLAAAERFVADYGSPKVTGGLAALDHAWASWLDRQRVDPADPDTVINAVGVAFGQALVDALDGFTWVSVDSDLAVFGAADVLIYPADLVAEQYQARTQTFLVAAHRQIVAEIQTHT